MLFVLQCKRYQQWGVAVDQCDLTADICHIMCCVQVTLLVHADGSADLGLTSIDPLVFVQHAQLREYFYPARPKKLLVRKGYTVPAAQPVVHNAANALQHDSRCASTHLSSFDKLGVDCTV